MSTKHFKLGAVALTVAAMLLPASQAMAAEYWLKAQTMTVNMPNSDPLLAATPVPVPMWGYASCDSAGTCGAATVPGPALTVLAGDSSLTVHLINELSVPTSLVINGLIKPMTPVWNDGSKGPRPSLTARVRSFDEEAVAGTPAVYTWPYLKPGTYLYQSGTQPQVQVQMGLYGAVSKNAVDVDLTAATPVLRAEAYPGLAYDNQATLLYSEIDPAMHAAIDDGSYGTAPAPTSTFNYAPKYFLINGQPYPDLNTAVTAPVGSPGTTLLRLLNAGLTTHVPMIQGTHWTLVAEDGKPYPYSANQYTALLPAAKTIDVMLTAPADIGGGTSYAIMDRRLNLSNSGVSDGGMLTYLRYGAQGTVGGGASDSLPNQPPVALDDLYNSVKGVTLSVNAADGVLNQLHSTDINAVTVSSPDYDPDNFPFPIRAVAATGPTANGGTYTLKSNGSFVYTPAVGFAGLTDSFQYLVTDGTALSALATVTINITVPSLPSTLTLLDNFDRATSSATSLGTASSTFVWSQQANTTTSVPDLGISGSAAKANMTALGGLAVLGQDFAETQVASFTSTGSLLNSALVLKASGSNLTSPANLIRVRCEAKVNSSDEELVVATMMGGSNVSVFVKQAAFPANGCSSAGTLSAVVDAKGLVTTFLGTSGSFVGGVQLPDVAAWKGRGKIGIQLQSLGATVDNFSGGSL
jgi:FtsP/CotA-like multicopper oxidase with cupredoxin domain